MIVSGDRADEYRNNLTAAGECGRLIASRDWSSTALGAVEAWSPSLRTATSLLLLSPVPMVMLWGNDGIMLYNDAYSVFAGKRHPELLGSRVREGWPEVADFNDKVMKVGLAGGTLAYQDQELTLYRNGRPEQVFMNLDYSPVTDEAGRPAGVLAIVVETTARVLAERRQTFLAELEGLLRDQDEPTEMMARATAALGLHLEVAQVGFGEIDETGMHVTVERDWNDGRIPSVVGTWQMDDFGPEFIASMKDGWTAPIPDVRTDPRTSAPDVVAAYDAIATRAILDVPLLRGGRMDEATRARAVEPFFSTKGIGKGTGLGLSMVHGLASQLGGAITIQSRPDIGTNVELWLPQTSVMAEALETSREVVTPTVTGTALLVDDEELVRMSTADMLQDLGYAVMEAASGEEAMRLIEEGRTFDLLVTDHLMPGMNGTDLAAVVRSARPGVPVLLVSGYAETEGIDPGLPRLTKPFRKDELAKSLSQISA